MKKIKIEIFNKEIENQNLNYSSKVYFTDYKNKNIKRCKVNDDYYYSTRGMKYAYKNISSVKRFITDSLNSK